MDCTPTALRVLNARVLGQRERNAVIRRAEELAKKSRKATVDAGCVGRALMELDRAAGVRA